MLRFCKTVDKYDLFLPNLNSDNDIFKTVNVKVMLP
jgi:hypothetical protein